MTIERQRNPILDVEVPLKAPLEKEQPVLNLENVDLTGVNLSAVDLRYADLQDARGLTQAQLDKACGNDKTELDEGLAIPTCPEEAPN